jgi:hypothetical protein
MPHPDDFTPWNFGIARPKIPGDLACRFTDDLKQVTQGQPQDLVVLELRL